MGKKLKNGLQGQKRKKKDSTWREKMGYEIKRKEIALISLITHIKAGFLKSNTEYSYWKWLFYVPILEIL